VGLVYRDSEWRWETLNTSVIESDARDDDCISGQTHRPLK
jgi:hypothetical protein